MSEISSAQVDEILRQAESRLRAGTGARARAVVPAASATKEPAIRRRASETEAAIPDGAKRRKDVDDLTVRSVVSSHPERKDTAGKDWFNLPKTEMTPEFKRDWQLLRMRSVLDPKHHKKAFRATAPNYSQVGEVIAGPTDFHSARLTRRERKKSLLEEAMAQHNTHKLKWKYADIQREKSSGKKAFYQRLIAQRRKRQNR